MSALVPSPKLSVGMPNVPTQVVLLNTPSPRAADIAFLRPPLPWSYGPMNHEAFFKRPDLSADERRLEVRLVVRFVIDELEVRGGDVVAVLLGTLEYESSGVGLTCSPSDSSAMISFT